jgi:hypothetical protein
MGPNDDAMDHSAGSPFARQSLDGMQCAITEPGEWKEGQAVLNREENSCGDETSATLYYNSLSHSVVGLCLVNILLFFTLITVFPEGSL